MSQKVSNEELFNSENKTIPNPPSIPSFEDFSLTKETYEHIKHKIEVHKRWLKYAESRYKSTLNVYAVIFSIIVVAIFIYINSKIWHYQIIAVIVVTYILSGIIFYIIVEYIDFKKWAIKNGEKLKYSPSASELAKYRNYEEAFKIYLQNRDKYEWELFEYNRRIEAKKSEYWFSLNGWDFESEFAKLLNRQGFKTQITSGSSDGGIDIFAMKDGVPFAIQCKAHKSPIGPNIIRDLYGSMNHNNIKNGILVNLGGFTKGVIDFAKDKSIILLDIDDVIKLHEGQKSI